MVRSTALAALLLPDPMFVVKDSAAALVAGETCFTEFPFATVVRETRGTETKELAAKDCPQQANGGAVVYTGR